MKTEVAIYPDQDAICLVLLEDGKPAEFIEDQPGATAQHKKLHRLDVVLGLVRQVVPALDCAFVDIGEPHDAMLPLRDARADVKAGQRLILQIRRETGEGKGYQVTGKVQIPGPYAVFNSSGQPKRRSKLRDFPPEEQEALFSQDLERLRQVWSGLKMKSLRGAAPRLLLSAGGPFLIALTSLVSDRLAAIRVEGSEWFQQIYAILEQHMPAYTRLLSLHVPQAGYGLAAVLGLEGLRKQLANRRVWLDGGGYLLIERTAALTVIDVNSGKDVRGSNSAGLRLRTNLEAVAAIARQIRLRNLGGIILIDFINMSDPADRASVQESLAEAVKRDRARCRLSGFTSLGLFEMTRQPL